MIIERDLLNKIEPFLKRREYIAIIGPRQAGKTTLLGAIERCLVEQMKTPSEQVKTITFEDRILLAQFEADPVEFVLSYFPGQRDETNYLMIDEFQYADEGGQKLKLIYDTVPKFKIIITGSSSLEIKAQVGRYLVGRVLSFYLPPFNFGEFLLARDKRLHDVYRDKCRMIYQWLTQGGTLPDPESKEDLFSAELAKCYEDYAVWGGYPAVTLCDTNVERQKVLRDIYNNYMLKDIKGLLELATEKNLLLLTRFLATQTGNIVVYKNLQNTANLNYRQTKKHMEILKETMIAQEVQPFFRNRQKELSKNPKIYFYDTGFRNMLIENMSGLEKRPDAGALIENSVFVRLHSLFHEEGRINFWRTKAGAEVDFILSSGEEPIPIEVKYGFLNNKDRPPRSFMNFVKSFAPPRGLILTKGRWGGYREGSTEILFAPVWYL